MICGVKKKIISGYRLAVRRIGPLVDKTHFKVAGNLSVVSLADTQSGTRFDPKTENMLHTYIGGGQNWLGLSDFSNLIISNNYKFKLSESVYRAVVITAGIVKMSRVLCC